MHVAILHNAVAADAPLEDQDTLVQVEAVAAAAARLGHRTSTLAATLDLAAMRDELLRVRPDVVFNLVESLDGADSLLHLPLAVLNVLGLPYVGSHATAMFLTTHKLLAKERLRSAGLPTPGWIVSGPGGTAHAGAGAPLERGDRAAGDKGSWIMKGVFEHGSRDMGDDAVLIDISPAEVQERLDRRAALTGRPCFAEQFIEGREFNVTVLAASRSREPEVLLPAEIDFSAFPAGKPRIVGYTAKWCDDRFEYHHTPRRFDYDTADGPLLDELRRLSARSWECFDLRGWVRVDFRVDRAGQPWILEINANPCLSPDAGFAAAGPMLDPLRPGHCPHLGRLR